MRSYICIKCQKSHTIAKTVIFCCNKDIGYKDKIHLSVVSKTENLKVGDFIIMPSIIYDRYDNSNWVYRKQKGKSGNYDKYIFFYLVIENKTNGKYDIVTDAIYNENKRITIDIKKTKNNIMKITNSLPKIENQAKELIQEYYGINQWT